MKPIICMAISRGSVTSNEISKAKKEVAKQGATLVVVECAASYRYPEFKFFSAPDQMPPIKEKK